MHSKLDKTNAKPTKSFVVPTKSFVILFNGFKSFVILFKERSGSLKVTWILKQMIWYYRVVCNTCRLSLFTVNQRFKSCPIIELPTSSGIFISKQQYIFLQDCFQYCVFVIFKNPEKYVCFLFTPLSFSFLENARWAPTHALTQPWYFKVFTDDGRQQLRSV